MSLEVVRHPSARALLDRSERWLLEAEDTNNLLLSLSYAVAEEESGSPAGRPGEGETVPFFATLERHGSVVGCAFRTPPHQVLLTDMPEEGAVALARHLGGVYGVLPAVLGPLAPAEAFAREWAERVGSRAEPGTDQRLYRLDEVSTLPAPGRMRRAKPEEAALMAAWADAFTREVHTRFGPGEEALAWWIERGFVHVWEDVVEGASAPVSMAVSHGRTPRGVRIGYVFTPPALRRHGYAGALVSELSRCLLDAGKSFCVLYADLSNPTTNALYQRMGYRMLCDVRDYVFHAPDRTEGAT